MYRNLESEKDKRERDDSLEEDHPPVKTATDMITVLKRKK